MALLRSYKTKYSSIQSPLNSNILPRQTYFPQIRPSLLQAVLDFQQVTKFPFQCFFR